MRLDSIYTTGPQRGLKKVGPPHPSASVTKDLFAILNKMDGLSLSNLVLVQGDDFATAVRDSKDWVAGPVIGEKESETQAREKSKKAWLFVYFGRGPSTPLSRKIESVGVYGQRIKVFFRRPDKTELMVTMDVQYYCNWIPLGELKPGKYVLELVDSDSGETELLRRQQFKGAE